MPDYEPSPKEVSAIEGAMGQQSRLQRAKTAARREFALTAYAWLQGIAPTNEYARFILKELEELDSWREDD